MSGMNKVIGIVEGSYSADDNLEMKNNLWIRRQANSITYVVLADSIFESEIGILATIGIPPLFYPLNGCLCKKRDAKEVQTIRHPATGVKTSLWHVKCDFDSNVDPDQEEEDPTNKRPVVSWGADFEDEVLTKDVLTGAALKTDADEPLFVEFPKAIPTLEVARYERWPFDPDIILNYVDHCNSTPFYGAPEGCAFMYEIETTEEIVEQVLYVKATYRIKFKIKKNTSGVMLEDTWKVEIPHMGYMYRKPLPSDPDTYGSPVTNINKDSGNPEKVRLENGTGRRLTGVEPTQYLSFNKAPKVNFNLLSLGPF